MVFQHAVADRRVFAFDDKRVNALHLEAKGLNERARFLVLFLDESG
jgi:hypothetical protein